MRIAAALLLVLLIHGTNDARSDALYGSSAIEDPYKFLLANACTISYPGEFAWAANISPAATSLSEEDQTRVIDLINTSTLTPAQVTDEMRGEFKSLMSKLALNARVLRKSRVLGRCSLKPILDISSFREGANSALPVIRISSRQNCELPKSARKSLRAGDKIAIFQASATLISAKLRRCKDGCGIVNCK